MFWMVCWGLQTQHWRPAEGSMFGRCCKVVLGDMESLIKLEFWGEVALSRFAAFQQLDARDVFVHIAYTNVEVSLTNKNSSLKCLLFDGSSGFKILPAMPAPNLGGTMRSSILMRSFGAFGALPRPFQTCVVGTVQTVSEVRQTKSAGTAMCEVKLVDEQANVLRMMVLGDWSDSGFLPAQVWSFFFVEVKDDELQGAGLICWVYDTAYLIQAPVEGVVLE